MCCDAKVDEKGYLFWTAGLSLIDVAHLANNNKPKRNTLSEAANGYPTSGLVYVVGRAGRCNLAL